MCISVVSTSGRVDSGNAWRWAAMMESSVTPNDAYLSRARSCVGRAGGRITSPLDNDKSDALREWRTLDGRRGGGGGSDETTGGSDDTTGRAGNGARRGSGERAGTCGNITSDLAAGATLALALVGALALTVRGGLGWGATGDAGAAGGGR